MTTYTKEEADFIGEVRVEYASLTAEDEDERFAEAILRACNKGFDKKIFKCYVNDYCFKIKARVNDAIDREVIIDCNSEYNMPKTENRDDIAASFYKVVARAKDIIGFIKYVKRVDFATKYRDLNIDTTESANDCIDKLLPQYVKWRVYPLNMHNGVEFRGDFPAAIYTRSDNILAARDFECTVLEYYNYFYMEAQDLKVAQDYPQ